MRIRINALNASPMGGSIIVNMIIPKAFSNAVETIIRSFKAGCEYDLKQFKQKRSLSANALCWVYCDELAKKLQTTKEDVYKNAISYVGVFEEIKFATPEAAQRFKKIWYSHGVGWLTKSIDECTLLAFYGSSTYNTQEMARLIDFLQGECKSQGIETKSEAEINSLLDQWGEK